MSAAATLARSATHATAPPPEHARRRRARRAYGVCLCLCLCLAALAGCGREPAPPSLHAATAAVVAAPAATAPPPHAEAPADPHDRAAEPAPRPSSACLAADAAASAPRATSIHRWVDAAGITHYSDRPPPAAATQQRVIEVHGLPPIAVDASGYDVDLPDQVQQRASADVLGVQRVLREALGVAIPASFDVRVVFVRAADAYARLLGNPLLAESAGAYATAQRTIYVRLQPQHEQDFAVLRHELTHALVHEAIGNLPTALNEGLAEYFARYHAAGLGGQVDLGADRAGLASAAPAGDAGDALVDLLAREGNDFYALDAGAGAREQRYWRAYALIALLMRGAPGRTALAAVLTAQQADPCRPVAAEAVLEGRYPGGLSALATEWADFMRSPPTDIRAY
ncbi:MAG TPA: DUF4124 domain-containing protein [Dokdonella sp.]